MKNSVIRVCVLGIAAIFAAVALLAIRSKESTEKSPRRLGETATYIVTFPDRDVAPWDRCYALAEARGGTVSAVYEEVNACSLTLPRAEVGSQTQDEIADVSDPSYPSVIFEENQMVYAWDGEEGNNIHLHSTQRFTQQASVSTSVWGLDRINQCSTSSDNIATPQDASNVVVFIVDTGILGTHNEFTGMMGSGCHYSAVGADPLKDGNGHGTHVAGTVCGETYGVARSCTLCAVQVLGSGGSGTTNGVIGGINHAISKCSSFTNKRCVINMSLGGSFSSSQNAAVRTAVEAGIVVVVAAGNSNADACTFSPASEPTVITVGSTTSSDVESSFSNHGSCVDIFAPGSGITSAWIGSNTATKSISGTSMASPHVAGIAAGILSSNTNFSPAQVRNLIVNRADGIPNNLKLATVVDCGSGQSTTTTKPTFFPTSKPTFKPTSKPTTSKPTTSEPTSTTPTSSKPTSLTPTVTSPTIPAESAPAISTPTSSSPTSSSPTSSSPTSSSPTSSSPTSSKPTSSSPTSSKPTSSSPTNAMPTSSKPTSSKPTSSKPTSSKPTSSKPTSSRPTSSKPTNTPTSALVTLQAPLCQMTSSGSSTSRSCRRQNGNMFHVDAKNIDISITSIKVSVASGTSLEVWTKEGSALGFENDKTAWTKIKDHAFSGNGMITIPLNGNVIISSGERQAFYVTVTDGYVYYGNTYAGDAANSIIVQNNDLVVHTGTANAYQFRGSLNPRFFNGAITYRKIG